MTTLPRTAANSQASSFTVGNPRKPPQAEVVAVLNADGHLEIYSDPSTKVLIVNEPDLGRAGEDLARQWVATHAPFWARRFLEHRFAGDLRARGNVERITASDLLDQHYEAQVFTALDKLEASKEGGAQ